MKNEKKVEYSKCGKGESRRKKVGILERGMKDGMDKRIKRREKVTTKPRIINVCRVNMCRKKDQIKDFTIRKVTAKPSAMSMYI